MQGMPVMLSRPKIVHVSIGDICSLRRSYYLPRFGRQSAARLYDYNNIRPHMSLGGFTTIQRPAVAVSNF